MKSNEIKILLKKYFDAETSLEEEKILSEYFQSEVASDLYEYKELFDLIQNSKSEEIQSSIFNNSFKEKISSTSKPRIFKISKKLFYSITSIAACLIIIFGVYLVKNSGSTKIEIESKQEIKLTEEQMKSCENTKKALIYVSSKLNSELEKLNKLSVFYEYQQVLKKKGKKA